ncbi:hypothetical protein [Blastococcus sp. LR1]|uniref:hypothetical protein n=1 Tax=Blastococcus sp. LR1 TaxID=2877000 RepID=UPI001CCFECA2|nr:hypothetical protein [Blastococcus sp. LR1]MCA0144434.1 hypothetical protein [Blastococcus sp. LR1]
MTATAAPPDLPTSPLAPALRHVLLAGVLGWVTALAGGPVVAASTLGGWSAVAVTLAGTAGISSLLAVALDRMAGPATVGRAGSVLRGCLVGLLGTAAVAGVALWVLQSPSDTADAVVGLPVPLLAASAAVPFAAVAALQWPGIVRITAAVLLVVAGAAVVIPAGQRAEEGNLAERILTEVGTLEHPWVADLDGYQNAVPQHTGSPLIWTPLEADSGRPDEELLLFRDLALDPAESDPCAAPFVRTPAGDATVTSCVQVRDGLYLRTADSGQELVRHDADVRIGVVAGPDVPVAVLEETLASARPMTDDEYETWLDEGMTPGW